MEETETNIQSDIPNLGTSPHETGVSLRNPLVGSVLSWVAVGLFYLTCIVLPLVGQAGKETPHNRANYITFAIIVILALLVSAAALASRFATRTKGLPWIQIGLVALNLIILLLLLTFSLGI